jgi:hypothetical protein
MNSSNKTNLKSLHKRERKLYEYLDKNGQLMKYCTTCLHRNNMADYSQIKTGNYLCKDGKKGWIACNPYGVSKKHPHWLSWRPRVDVDYFKEEEFKIK